jgi:hypothetical protein
MPISTLQKAKSSCHETILSTPFQPKNAGIESWDNRLPELISSVAYATSLLYKLCLYLSTVCEGILTNSYKSNKSPS